MQLAWSLDAAQVVQPASAICGSQRHRLGQPEYVAADGRMRRNALHIAQGTDHPLFLMMLVIVTPIGVCARGRDAMRLMHSRCGSSR